MTAVAVVAAQGDEQLRGGYSQPEPYRMLLDSLGNEADGDEFPQCADSDDFAQRAADGQQLT